MHFYFIFIFILGNLLLKIEPSEKHHLSTTIFSVSGGGPGGNFPPSPWLCPWKQVIIVVNNYRCIFIRDNKLTERFLLPNFLLVSCIPWIIKKIRFVAAAVRGSASLELHLGSLIRSSLQDNTALSCSKPIKLFLKQGVAGRLV